jgi:hypothetical protein
MKKERERSRESESKKNVSRASTLNSRRCREKKEMIALTVVVQCRERELSFYSYIIIIHYILQSVRHVTIERPDIYRIICFKCSYLIDYSSI